MSTTALGFSGHETFSFRYGWLKKGVEALRARPDIFSADDATSYLGVGKNMVRSIKHWCLATGLLEELTVPGSRSRHLTVSAIGKAVIAENGFDPYLEDPNTLWLLHYGLARESGRSQTWHWAFCHYNKREFTKLDLAQELLAVAQSTPSSRANLNTIKRDVDCFIRTYVPSRVRKSIVLEDTLDCPLVELGLINELADHQTYAFDAGERTTLTNEMFAYSLIDFWESHQPTKNTCTMEAITYGIGGPGRVFRITDRELVSRLEQIEKLTDGAFSYDETAGLKQVYRRESVSPTQMLSRAYAHQRSLT